MLLAIELKNIYIAKKFNFWLTCDPAALYLHPLLRCLQHSVPKANFERSSKTPLLQFARI